MTKAIKRRRSAPAAKIARSVSVYLTEDLLKELDKQSKTLKMTRSALIQDILEAGLAMAEAMENQGLFKRFEERLEKTLETFMQQGGYKKQKKRRS